ncbi:MAG: hypothetical protein IKJ59_16465 [Clostridia bacterium]|nr:hypothetical protein [Clostridia bacterium]
MLSVVFSGCSNTTVSLGTYQNENNTEQQVIITENSIKFINVSFDEFNEELRQDMGVDLRLTDFMSSENSYTVKDGVLSVDIGSDIAVSFEYGKDYIIVNEKEFKLS